MNIIAIIPARGGSKRLPRKNIRELCGKPLIAWTIEQAKRSKFIDKVVVSTDDEEIAAVSRDYGADVPFLRPKELATDDSPTIDAVLHVIHFLEKNEENYDIVVLLQPTSPLRNTYDIDDAIKLFIENDVDSVISIFEVENSPFWTFNIKNGFLNPLFDKKYLKMNHKDLPTIYAPNGAISISYVKDIIKSRSFYFEKSLPYFMPPERSIDIDTKFDFNLSEKLMEDLKLIK